MNLRITTIINIIIFLSFFGRFGINVNGQDIYYYYIFEIFLLSVLFVKHGIKIDTSGLIIKLLISFYILAIVSSILSVFSNVPDFKGQSITTSSLKGMIYLTLNILMIMLLVTYCNNENFFKGLEKGIKILILFYLFYFFLEAYHDYFSQNYFINRFLNFFHTSSRSIDKSFINLLGHEHSNTSVYLSILYSYMVINLLNKRRVFRFFLFDFFIIIIFVIALFLAESKLGYAIFTILNLAIFMVNLINSKNKFSYLVSSLILIIVLIFFYDLFGGKINKAISLVQNYDHPSTNIRVNFALASLVIMFQNPFFGIGINNFKFYVEDAIYYVEKLNWINLKLEGPGLEYNTYLYNAASSPDPANMITGIGAEMGMIGLTVFLILFLSTFFKGYSHIKKYYLNKNEKILAEFLFYSLIVVILSFVGFYQLYFMLQWIILGINILFFKFIFHKYKYNGND